METVVAIALERMGQAVTSQAVFNTIFDPIWEKDIALSTLSMGAIRAGMLMDRYGYTSRPLGRDRRAQLRRGNHQPVRPDPQADHGGGGEDVEAAVVAAAPVRMLPDVRGRLRGGRHVATAPRPPGVDPGIASLTDTYAMGDRMHRPEGSLIDLVTLRMAADRAYQQAGVQDAGEQFDVVEIHAPFSSAEAMAYAPLRLCAPEDGPAFVERSLTDGGGPVINPSGGPQAANPVSATALVRIVECAARR